MEKSGTVVTMDKHKANISPKTMASNKVDENSSLYTQPYDRVPETLLVEETK